MCGIAGYLAYRSGGRVAAERDLVAARDAMRLRGPDGSGLWWDKNDRVGLAHRRLAIIDLADRALQPMHLAEHGLTIVFNGEIYNYRDLRDDLILRHGFRPRTESDTEVILALFAYEGAPMLDRLRGMFAFAIWDEKDDRLFLARDPYGIKPLYYADRDGAFYFASQVKALRHFAALSKESDPAGIVGFQLLGSVPEPFTIYRDIGALPAGSYMWVDDRGASAPISYARIVEDLAHAQPDNKGDVAAVVAAAARDSVAAHLVADVEVGAFLSSGIDSGSLVGLMRDLGQNRIRAITLGFEELRGTAADEAPLARQIARQYGAEHYVRTITGQEFAAAAERILNDMDQPSVDGVNTWFVSMAAHECGLKVVLSGLGGDELLGGYSNFQTIPSTRRIGTVAGLPVARQFGKAMLRWFAPGLLRRNPKVLGFFDGDGSWEGAYLLRRAVMLPFELNRHLDAETVREGLERLQPLSLIRSAITPRPAGTMATVSALESSIYMRNQLLRDADWASMAHSLELRVPYVDRPTLRRIAPFVERLNSGAGKRALATAPAVDLPRECIGRARTGFNIPVATWTGLTANSGDRLSARHWSRRVADAFSVA